MTLNAVTITLSKYSANNCVHCPCAWSLRKSRRANNVSLGQMVTVSFYTPLPDSKLKNWEIVYFQLEKPF